MTILLLEPYFKINGWIYRGILKVLVKKSLNLISFPPILHNFEKWKFEILKNRNEWIFLPIYFIPFYLNTQTKKRVFHSFP